MIKSLFLQLVLLFSCLVTRADNRPGYYITLAGDTVKSTIHRGLNWFGDRGYTFITVVDAATGKKTTYHPNEIRGFGFEDEDHYLHFSSKPIDNDGKLRFLEVARQTPKLSLFYHDIFRSGGGSPPMLWQERYFTLEHNQGEFLFFKDFGSMKKLRKQISEFFNDDPAVVSFTEAHFKKGKYVHQDMIELMQLITK